MEIVEIWQNLEKKRNTDYDFSPLYVAENNNLKRSCQSIGLSTFKRS